ncbi:MAG: pirin family protein [Pseudomonadota bacterium]
MIKRAANDRGTADFGWLKSRHTFSFGHYYDPKQMGFGVLRVINEDRVVPGAGFDTHGHRDMEIISYVLDGALEHKDSQGNHSIIRPGDVQRMTAGTGIRHSEYNASTEDPVHFLQIWVLPDRAGHRPGYEQIAYPDVEKRGQLRLVASGDGREGSVTLHQDLNLFAGLIDGSETASIELKAGRQAWVQVARGDVEVNGETLKAGDGLAIADAGTVTVAKGRDAEILVFEMRKQTLN